MPRISVSYGGDGRAPNPLTRWLAVEYESPAVVYASGTKVRLRILGDQLEVIDGFLGVERRRTYGPEDAERLEHLIIGCGIGSNGKLAHKITDWLAERRIRLTQIRPWRIRTWPPGEAREDLAGTMAAQCSARNAEPVQAVAKMLVTMAAERQAEFVETVLGDPDLAGTLRASVTEAESSASWAAWRRAARRLSRHSMDGWTGRLRPAFGQSWEPPAIIDGPYGQSREIPDPEWNDDRPAEAMCGWVNRLCYAVALHVTHDIGLDPAFGLLLDGPQGLLDELVAVVRPVAHRKVVEVLRADPLERHDVSRDLKTGAWKPHESLQARLTECEPELRAEMTTVARQVRESVLATPGSTHAASERLETARGYLGDFLADEDFFDAEQPEAASWFAGLGAYVHGLPLTDRRILMAEEYLQPFLDDDDRVDGPIYAAGEAIRFIERGWGGSLGTYLIGFVRALGGDWRKWRELQDDHGQTAQWRMSDD